MKKQDMGAADKEMGEDFQVLLRAGAQARHQSTDDYSRDMRRVVELVDKAVHDYSTKVGKALTVRRTKQIEKLTSQLGRYHASANILAMIETIDSFQQVIQLDKKTSGIEQKLFRSAAAAINPASSLLADKLAIALKTMVSENLIDPTYLDTIHRLHHALIMEAPAEVVARF